MRRSRPVALAAAAYLLLTLAFTWPLPIELGHGVPHDLGDPLLNAWILWWSTKAVPLTTHWWNAPMFCPAAGTLAFSEHLLGLLPISGPLILVTRHPLLGYNVALIASYVFCGLGAYFLGYTLTRRHDAAFVAGLAFAFAPYRVAQLPHLQVLSSYWSPVCLAALHRYAVQPRVRWAALAAGAWLMQGLACGYYLLFLSALLVLWFFWFAVGRWPFRQFAIVAAAWGVAALSMAPIPAGYRHFLTDTYGFGRRLEEIQGFSADIASLLQASPDSLLWRWIHVFAKPEGELFPGVTIVVLALFAIAAAHPFRILAAPPTKTRRWIRRVSAAMFAGCAAATSVAIYYGRWRLAIGGATLLSVGRPDKPLTLTIFAALVWLATSPTLVAAARRRSLLLFYVVATFAMWVFALGPDPTVFGARVLYQAPYGWLMQLPAFGGLRVPARFWMMSLLCLSAIAAAAVSKMSPSWRRAAVIGASVGLLLDGWPAHVTVHAEPDARPLPGGALVRLELPITLDVDAAALYRQTFDGVPTYNGFSGYVAPHYYALRELLGAHDERALKALASAGAVGVVVDHAIDDDGHVRKWLGSSALAKIAHSGERWSSYLVAPSPWRAPPDVGGTVLPIKAVDAYPSPAHAIRAIDGDLRTRWSGGVQQQSAGFIVELSAPSRARQLVLYLAEFITDFPRRLRVETSPDGSTWNTEFLGDTALEAYFGAVRHPRQMPIVIPLSGVNVRWIRMAQLGSGTHDWSIAELEVRGELGNGGAKLDR